MVNYCTVQNVKDYQRISSSTDDDLLEMFIEIASRDIDMVCDRRFYGASETRKFNPVKDAEGNLLLLDFDLQSVSGITNGDGVAVASDKYVLEPTNFTPKYGIRLKRSGSVVWTFTTDPEEAISVTGVWGYVSGTVPPAQIKHACIRLAFWYYKQKDAPFEATGLPGSDQVTAPVAMPTDVERILEPFKRRKVLAVGGYDD